MTQEILRVKLKNAIISSNVRLIKSLDEKKLDSYKNIGEYRVLIDRRNYHLLLAEKKGTLLKVFYHHHERLRYNRMAFDESEVLKKLQSGQTVLEPMTSTVVAAEKGLNAKQVKEYRVSQSKKKILSYTKLHAEHQKQEAWYINQVVLMLSWLDMLKKQVQRATKARDNLYVLIGLKTEFEKDILQEKLLYHKLRKADSVYLRSTMAKRVKMRIVYWDKMIEEYHPKAKGQSSDMKQLKEVAKMMKVKITSHAQLHTKDFIESQGSCKAADIYSEGTNAAKSMNTANPSKRTTNTIKTPKGKQCDGPPDAVWQKEEAQTEKDHAVLQKLYKELIILSVKRKLTCEAYYRTNKIIWKDDKGSFRKQKLYNLARLKNSYKKRVMAINNGKSHRAQAELIKEKVWSRQLKDIDMRSLTGKLELQVRYFQVRTKQLSLRIKYDIQMIKKVDFHLKLKTEKSAYWKKTIAFKTEHKNIKIAEYKQLAGNNLKQNKIKLEGLEGDLKVMNDKAENELKNGKLNQVVIVRNKADLIKNLIIGTKSQMVAEKTGNVVLNKLQADIVQLKGLYADQAKQEVINKKKADEEKVRWEASRQKSVKELELLLKQSEKASKLLSTGSEVKIELPTIDGLEIPEGIFCDKTSKIYLNCWYSNWKEINDLSKFYCQIWGKDRGKCVHINEEGAILDFNTLNLNYFTETVCGGIPEDKLNVECLDYTKYKKRLCSIDNVLGCNNDWEVWNPNLFTKNKCKQKLFTQTCINQTGTIFRRCDKYNENYWKCSNYAMANNIVTDDLLYVAYLTHYWDAYDVSVIGQPKKDDDSLGNMIGINPESNGGGSGSEIIDSWTEGEQILGEVM